MATEEKKPVGSVSITENAFQRVIALRKAELVAADRMKNGDDYPDFFVEGSGPPWHERWPEVVNAKKFFSDDRMLFVDRLHQDDYPDFFVEGSGPPWHERWPEVVTAGRLDLVSLQGRMKMLRNLNVMQAYLNLRARIEK